MTLAEASASNAHPLPFICPALQASSPQLSCSALQFAGHLKGNEEHAIISSGNKEEIAKPIQAGSSNWLHLSPTWHLSWRRRTGQMWKQYTRSKELTFAKKRSPQYCRVHFSPNNETFGLHTVQNVGREYIHASMRCLMVLQWSPKYRSSKNRLISYIFGWCARNMAAPTIRSQFARYAVWPCQWHVF